MASRRRFLELLAAVMGPDIAAFQQSGAAGRAMPPDGGELCHVGPSRDPVRIKVSQAGDTGTRISMIVQDMSPGTSIPMHLHEREDEIILIQAGSGTAQIGDDQAAITAGSVLWVPQGTWHAGRNTGTTTLRWTGIYAPAGFEGYFREISVAPGAAPRRRSPAEWEALDAKYGIRYRR